MRSSSVSVTHGVRACPGEEKVATHRGLGFVGVLSGTSEAWVAECRSRGRGGARSNSNGTTALRTAPNLAERSAQDAMAGDEPLAEPPRAKSQVIGAENGVLVFWFDSHTPLICLAVFLSAVVNTFLMTSVAFVGIGWDWDVLLTELAMQATNFMIAACLHFRKYPLLLRHPDAKRRTVVLIAANALLRIAVFVMLLEIGKRVISCAIFQEETTCSIYAYSNAVFPPGILASMQRACAGQ